MILKIKATKFSIVEKYQKKAFSNAVNRNDMQTIFINKITIVIISFILQ